VEEMVEERYSDKEAEYRAKICAEVQGLKLEALKMMQEKEFH